MSRFNGVLTLMVLVILSTGSLPTQAHRRFFGHRQTFWNFPSRSRPQRAFHGGRVNRPMFDGNGCNPGTVALVNSSDTTSYSLSVLFSTFTAQTSGTKTRDNKHCVITVALEPAENMQIGVARVDFRGDAYVPGERSWARLQAFYRLGYFGREVLVNRKYDAGFDDVIYETGEVTPISWTPCARFGPVQRKHEFRIHAMITAAKKTVAASEVSIAIDSIDANVQKGVYYQLITRACPGTPQSVPAMRPASETQAPITPAPETPAPVTPAPVTPAPETLAPVTPAPFTPAPVTPAPDTPAPVTPTPGTPASITPTSDTQASITPASDTTTPSSVATQVSENPPIITQEAGTVAPFVEPTSSTQVIDSPPLLQNLVTDTLASSSGVPGSSIQVPDSVTSDKDTSATPTEVPGP